jgi:hypothetical protein
VLVFEGTPRSALSTMPALSLSISTRHGAARSSTITHALPAVRETAPATACAAAAAMSRCVTNSGLRMSVMEWVCAGVFGPVPPGRLRKTPGKPAITAEHNPGMKRMHLETP